MHRSRPCYGRRKIRAENKRVPVPVEKFVEFIGRCRSDIARKDVKIFDRRCLDIGVTEGFEHVMDPLHERPAVLKTFSVEIPHALGRMHHPVLYNHSLSPSSKNVILMIDVMTSNAGPAAAHARLLRSGIRLSV